MEYHLLHELLDLINQCGDAFVSSDVSPH
jgi:hypothetical protein